MEGEAPSVWTESYPKARKEHKCYECDRIIKPGEKYHNFKGCWEGKWAEFKTCEPCNDLRHEIGAEDSDGSMPPFGHLSEWAYESDRAFPVSD